MGKQIPEVLVAIVTRGVGWKGSRTSTPFPQHFSKAKRSAAQKKSGWPGVACAGRGSELHKEQTPAWRATPKTLSSSIYPICPRHGDLPTKKISQPVESARRLGGKSCLAGRRAGCTEGVGGAPHCRLEFTSGASSILVLTPGPPKPINPSTV